jgi:protocatechuate 3,4-dioxygenase beta subunit
VADALDQHLAQAADYRFRLRQSQYDRGSPNAAVDRRAFIISISDLSACRGPEGRPSLGVDFRVIDGATCALCERARVDIWHADAPRFYSDYKRQIDNEDLSTVGQAFLRRTQFTYCEGAVNFHGG